MNHHQNESMKVYGNPDPNGDGMPDQLWINANIRRVFCPWPLVADWDMTQSIKSIPIHRICAQSLDDILNDLWVGRFGQDYARVQKAGMHRFAGSFNYRPSRHGRRLSEHAYAGAIDFNAGVNALGRHYIEGTMMPRDVAAVFIKYGWTWGAFWNTPDAMHFQYARV